MPVFYFCWFLIFQPPFIQSLPNSIAIKEDTPPNEVIYTTEVTDLYGDPVCCTLFDTHPQTFNFNVTNDPPGSSVYHVITTRTARFRYEDFNSYMIYMCCDDTQNRAEGVLIVNIKKPVVTAPYTPPSKQTLFDPESFSMTLIYIHTIWFYYYLLSIDLRGFCCWADPRNHISIVGANPIHINIRISETVCLTKLTNNDTHKYQWKQIT